MTNEPRGETRPGKTARSNAGAVRTRALDYAHVLKWPLLPGHSVRDDGSCSCTQPECASPGAHPVLNPWRGFAAADAEDVWTVFSLYPDASVLVVPDTFIGISVPTWWGATTAGLGESEGGFTTPTIDGRGWSTFLCLPPKADELAHLTQVASSQAKRGLRWW